MSLASHYYATSPDQISLHTYMPATQFPVCLFLCQLLHMPAANSIISIYSLMQSFILACYMSALYANNSMSNSMP
jgi:hypothetical protein